MCPFDSAQDDDRRGFGEPAFETAQGLPDATQYQYKLYRVNIP